MSGQVTLGDTSWLLVDSRRVGLLGPHLFLAGGGGYLLKGLGNGAQGKGSQSIHSGPISA